LLVLATSFLGCANFSNLNSKDFKREPALADAAQVAQVSDVSECLRASARALGLDAEQAYGYCKLPQALQRCVQERVGSRLTIEHSIEACTSKVQR
jgi:hypothetical protein